MTFFFLSHLRGFIAGAGWRGEFSDVKEESWALLGILNLSDHDQQQQPRQMGHTQLSKATQSTAIGEDTINDQLHRERECPSSQRTSTTSPATVFG